MTRSRFHQRRRNLPKRLPNLPAEVWLYIFQLVNNFDNRYTVQYLSSVNRFLRDLALPVLFGTVCLLGPAEWDFSTRFQAQFGLEQVVQRIRYINSSSDVLNVVRRLTLTDWWISPCDDDMSDGSIDLDDYSTDDPAFDPIDYREDYREFVELTNYACQEVVDLVFSFPNLHHLLIHDSSFTPEFFFRTLCVPNLQSLHFDKCS